MFIREARGTNQELFRDCGEINAITIPVDKHTGRAKGFAYLEFADKVKMVLNWLCHNDLISFHVSGVYRGCFGKEQQPAQRSANQSGQ
jgi:RNA recognition motif-containing protein